MTQNKKKEPVLPMGAHKIIPKYDYGKSFTVRFPDRFEWKHGLKNDREGELIWYTDGSKTSKGTRAGVYAYGTRRKLSVSLGQYITVFQAEVYVIKACMFENLDRNYRNRNICILSYSQALIEALSNHLITSEVMWDCHQSLIHLAKHSTSDMSAGSSGHYGNERADQLAKQGSEHPFIRPEPACSISIGAAKKAVRD
jgi:ribonuclease HI